MKLKLIIYLDLWVDGHFILKGRKVIVSPDFGQPGYTTDCFGGWVSIYPEVKKDLSILNQLIKLFPGKVSIREVKIRTIV